MVLITLVTGAFVNQLTSLGGGHIAGMVRSAGKTQGESRVLWEKS